QEEYETAIQQYLSRLNCDSYEIERKERGIIPMTDYPFHRVNTKRVLMIGSAGGWTRASTGYTFKNSGILAERVAKKPQCGWKFEVADSQRLPPTREATGIIRITQPRGGIGHQIKKQGAAEGSTQKIKH
ncbi:MAG: hypothetical protein EBT89_12625, partial [Opitutaceae bacterium]|nr:hypothetical protein [Opitutaceae bacterium]